MIDQDMCQESIKKLPRNLDGSRIYQECVEQTESIEKILDGSSCYQGSVEVTKKSLDRKDFYWWCVEKLSSLKKRGFSRREKHREMNATSKLSTKHPSDVLSSQNSTQHRCKAFIDPKTHTH